MNLNPRHGNQYQSDADRETLYDEYRSTEPTDGKSKRAEGLKAHGLQGSGLAPRLNGDQRRMGGLDG